MFGVLMRGSECNPKLVAINFQAGSYGGSSVCLLHNKQTQQLSMWQCVLVLDLPDALQLA